MPDSRDRLEIMQACSQKIALSPDVDLVDYVEATNGYSGADLQALIYNAHLESIHATISASKLDNGSLQEVEEIRFLTFGGVTGTSKAVLSRAETGKLEERVSYCICT